MARLDGGVCVGKRAGYGHAASMSCGSRERRAPIELTLPPPDSVLSLIDADAFAILARNLIENALKHGAPDRAIEVALSPSARLSVVNAGRIVPAADLAQLSGHFVRGGSRAEGFGLGLA